MNTETYLKKIDEAEKLAIALDEVIAKLDKLPGHVTFATYRMAVKELGDTLKAIDRWRKFVAIKDKSTETSNRKAAVNAALACAGAYVDDSYWVVQDGEDVLRLTINEFNELQRAGRIRRDMESSTYDIVPL